jgi:hypothetical protein
LNAAGLEMRERIPIIGENQYGSNSAETGLLEDLTQLLVAQGYHGINFRGAPCRDIGGDDRDED